MNALEEKPVPIFNYEQTVNELGMKVIFKYTEIPCSQIKLNLEYQRCIDNTRLKKISDSIKKYGYWPQEVIIINNKYEVIDGQHRFVAAKQNGINIIPVSIVSFPCKENEAKFFTLKNNYNTSLKNIDYWHAAHIAKHPLANILYSLNYDDDSLLKDMIALKGTNTEHSKFSTAQCMLMISQIGLNLGDRWNKQTDERITQKAKETAYIAIKQNINLFCKWFYDCFSSKKRDNPIPYRDKSFRSIVTFYRLLKKQNFLITGLTGYRTIINKIQQYTFTNDFVKTDQIGQIMALVNHFNKNKRHKVIYTV